MNPADIPNVEAMLQLWMLGMIRPGAAFLAAPVFGATNVPIQLRLVMALAVGVPAVAASGMTLPADGLVSFPGFILITGEVVIGLAMGFVLQMGLAAALLGGEAISNAMGLGFASMVDPLSGTASSAIGQFLSMLATAIFLAADGHLVLISIIVDSYDALPPGGAFPSWDAIGGIIRFGSLMFAAGLTIALPVGFVLILVQIIMGVIGRSAPALNLFAVGIPATLLAGVILLGVATPVMAEALAQILSDALDAARMVAAG
ncbi:flagellar biosynthetic protein FliR [Sphingopyxis sp. YF1]|jgi:flagellar biosynthetic protein FliR|uniref:flagellar biosynthetic protein FliR n=1 Tax=Sphingopyxis sp. YF1 TaxID=2482763 RepID=UPI001F6151F8|nr:flagellar biosynthetic protein FliR [Sphingopyxis sp. YF1]UNU43121.1 flagellar biosynthetic protein FliR [Sphingopyxis sp. YF1]HZG31970.1 flagellar biosynthetic protein FliR [Sphingopyxis sp.]